MTARHATARMRSLATELTELRVKAGLTTREAAKLIGTSPSSLNRLENGGKVIAAEDVSALLVAYGVTGVKRGELLGLARESDVQGWWETGGSLPRQATALITFEAQATRIVNASMLLVPGLLQTAEYTRAVMTATGVTGAEMESMVSARLGRQAVLSKPRPPAYLAIIDEAVLRRPMGGAEVMAAQLRHIVEAARRPHIDVRVLPLSRGGHTGLDGTYVLLEFAAERPIVHLEHKRSGLFMDELEDVSPFQTATDTLVATALGPADSTDFLASVADDFT
ncbi:helix-turn-helix domain-containing protein [Amycolatopsis antarctica]|nr:helix-turn-helix transcriptional regulator [Amycolatopsis antarctica]